MSTVELSSSYSCHNFRQQLAVKRVKCSADCSAIFFSLPTELNNVGACAETGEAWELNQYPLQKDFPNILTVWRFLRWILPFKGKVDIFTLYLILVSVYLPFRKRRVQFWPWFFPRRRIALCTLKRMPVMAEYYVIDFCQFHWLRGKISLTCCREQQAGFCQSVALLLWFCGPCEGSTIMLVKMFSDMSCLEDNASRYCKTNTAARSV